jgi:hypothetical protein
MKNNVDDPLWRAMQHFANEPVVHEIPTAAQSWSQIQFRLRYRSQRRDRSYMSTLMQIVVATWTLLLVVRLAGGPLALVIGPMLGFAVLAAVVLHALIYRAVRS